jgi:hypothetical protein
MNLLTVEIHGNAIWLYANKSLIEQFIIGIRFVYEGKAALVAESVAGPADVAYQDLAEWQ